MNAVAAPLRHPDPASAPITVRAADSRRAEVCLSAMVRRLGECLLIQPCHCCSRWQLVTGKRLAK